MNRNLILWKCLWATHGCLGSHHCWVSSQPHNFKQECSWYVQYVCVYIHVHVHFYKYRQAFICIYIYTHIYIYIYIYTYVLEIVSKKKRFSSFFASVSISTKNRFSHKRLQRGAHNIYFCWNVSILCFSCTYLFYVSIFRSLISCVIRTQTYLFLAKRIHFCHVSIFNIYFWPNVSIFGQTYLFLSTYLFCAPAYRENLMKQVQQK